jgi:hypothetical protein
VRLEYRKTATSSAANRAPIVFAAHGSVAIEYSCDGASMKRKIMSDGRGLRGISAESAEAAALVPDLGSRVAAVGRAGLSRRQDWGYLSNIPQATAKPASAGCGALHVWSAFALLMTLMTVPLFSTVLPPLFDYPNHLARLYLLMEGGNAFYTVQWEPLPNLAQDLIVPSLAVLMPLALASKLFLVMVFGLITGGAIWLNRVATGAWRVWPLLAFLLLYNRIFYGALSITCSGSASRWVEWHCGSLSNRGDHGSGCLPRRLWRSSAISVTLLRLGFMLW